MKEVVKNEILKLLRASIIYSISDSRWVSPIHVVPKKGGMTIIEGESGEMIPSRTATSWRVCIDYRKLNKATRKDHFPLPFIDQMLERLASHSYFCFLMVTPGFSKFRFTRRTKRKRHSHALLERLLIGVCLLDCAMHLLRSKGV